jgi:PPK2 family polyphosphate:nucleotide phosphotransferase
MNRRPRSPIGEPSSCASPRMHVRDFRVAPGEKVRLKDHKTDWTGAYADKDEVAAALAKGLDRLRELQRVLYAERKWALLVVFQAMDAAGKDSTVGHVLSGLNPQGCSVRSFKVPSSEELDHHFLWRISQALPARGMIGVFNRSHYEEVLAVRVHPEVLHAQRLPESLVGPHLWKERFEDINAFERHLTRSGTVVVKFFLHLSKEAQRERFLERLEKPKKHWKFTPADVREREYWGAYQAAYEEVLSNTSTKAAPWYVIPADRKWFSRLSVTNIIVERLEQLDLRFPEPDAKTRREMRTARKILKEK